MKQSLYYTLSNASTWANLQSQLVKNITRKSRIAQQNIAFRSFQVSQVKGWQAKQPTEHKRKKHELQIPAKQMMSYEHFSNSAFHASKMTFVFLRKFPVYCKIKRILGQRSVTHKYIDMPCSFGFQSNTRRQDWFEQRDLLCSNYLENSENFWRKWPKTH